MTDITQTDRAAFWRDLWSLRGQHSTPIADVGYRPDMRTTPHPEYAAPWQPDDEHRERNRIRRETQTNPEAIADWHPLDGGW